MDPITPYTEIARLLAEHRISGVPVLTVGRHVAGVVSEADLLTVEEQHARQAPHRQRRAAGQALRRPVHSGPTARHSASQALIRRRSRAQRARP